jgi:hypothetical protein
MLDCRAIHPAGYAAKQAERHLLSVQENRVPYKRHLLSKRDRSSGGQGFAAADGLPSGCYYRRTLMKLAVRIAMLFLSVGCTSRVSPPSVVPPSAFDFISLHWEAKGSSNNIRICDLKATGQKIPLEAETVLGLRHFASAQVTHEPETSTHSVTVMLTPEGRDRLKDATAEHVGRRLAIVIDNDIVGLPLVMRPIDIAELPLMPIADAQLAERLAERINTAVQRRQ